ncbi:hypothetical protein HDV04_003995 [Boothiomyces sp. JEL0838]|nr:hypothetical protein HDV04_003995 [Boothiomyces sp. JEL0838]
MTITKSQLDSILSKFTFSKSKKSPETIERIKSFSTLTWFSKPLNSVELAKRGWINTNVDEITCVSCHTTIVIESRNPFGNIPFPNHNPDCIWNNIVVENEIYTFSKKEYTDNFVSFGLKIKDNDLNLDDDECMNLMNWKKDGNKVYCDFCFVYLDPKDGFDCFSHKHWCAVLKEYKNNLKLLNYQQAIGWNEQEKRSEMAEPETNYIISEFGFLSFQLTVDHEYVQDFVEIPVLYVYELQIKKGHQGKGYGKLLMEIAEDIARESSMKQVKLTVFKCNKEAIGFYQKMGYTVDSTCLSKHMDEQEFQSVGYWIYSKKIE